MWWPAPVADSSIGMSFLGRHALLRGVGSSPVGDDKVGDWFLIWQYADSRLMPSSALIAQARSGHR
jgi:hypothetical protein